MRPPDFWYNSEVGIAPKMLMPAGLAYSLASRIRRFLIKPWHPGVPVICIGNLVAGGSGKTPTAISIAHYFQNKGLEVHFLSRGYGGTIISLLGVGNKDGQSVKMFPNSVNSYIQLPSDIPVIKI